jgi:hypothetical protein
MPAQPMSQNTVFPFSLLWGIGGVLLIMAFLVALGPYSNEGMFAPDQGRTWYYWKLQDPTFWTRLSAWLLYGFHQVSIWLLIFIAQQKRPGYVQGLHPINALALGLNALFVLLHIGQTKIWYDGLAQDTSVMSSQASVVFMLSMILIMENRRRGLFFGKKAPLLKSVGDMLRRYHGYYFSWAVIYTFWFHPIETTMGHLTGTFYTVMLMLQGSLFFTRFHTNRYWTVSLELMVAVHGSIVAWQLGGDAMKFVFGFLAVFIITQMHGLGLGRRARTGFVVTYALVVLVCYSGQMDKLIELPRVPVIEYTVVFITALILWLAFILPARLLSRRIHA